MMRRLLCLPAALLLTLALAASLHSCRMEPPLNIPATDNIEVRLGEVILDLNIIWGIEQERVGSWWYGWDDVDVGLWGKIEYPTPSTYELRLYYLGTTSPQTCYLSLERLHLTETRFRRALDFGYHNLLAWSNINSPDGTQVLQIDESDPRNIYATTSHTRVALPLPSRAILNNPELFYSAYEQGFEITDNPADYTYYDAEQNVYVKQLNASLYPRSYIYLVQVVIYNNRGRVIGLTDQCAVSGLAGAVQLHTGRTSRNEVAVAFEMRMKPDLPARDGRLADILGGKLTTFGLCDMEGWTPGRSIPYSGTRTDLANGLHLGLRFSAGTDSLYSFDITPQLRAQTHGGIVTVEIDADTLPVPSRPGAAVPTGGFDPTVAPADSIEHVFVM